MGVRSYREKFTSYRIYLLADTITSWAMGLFAPYWFLYIEGFGSSGLSFGSAIAIMIAFQSGFAYYAGRYSDRFGRKRFMLGGRLALSLIIVLYTLINSLPELFVLQAMYGIAWAVVGVTESAFLADVTESATRGEELGVFNLITGLATAIAMVVGGISVDYLGFSVVFYVTASFFLASSFIIIVIKEQRV